LQYKTDAKCEAATEEDKKDLKTQLFKADDMDDEDFEWKEQPIKPGFQRPVIIHRAILGSVERFMAILIEHLGGKWPFFLSPRQAIICPISEKFADYCESVYLYLHKQGYQVELDVSNLTLNKKIRNHQLEQWNFILVAGEEEAQSGMVDIRTRDNERVGKMRVDQLHEYFQTLMPGKSNKYEEFYAKAWDPSKFNTSTCGDHGSSKGKMEKCTLYSPSEFDAASLLIKTVADIAGA
jgi:threonyl-tRNA synthetase